MAWLKLDDTFCDSDKIDSLAESLGISWAEAAGLMATLWSWALRHAPDGVLGERVRKIERGAKWGGDPGAFVGAAVDSGLLDRTETGFVVHNWLRRGGSYAERMRKRLERQRETVQNVQDSPGQSKMSQNVQDKNGRSGNVRPRVEENRVEEKRRESIADNATRQKNRNSDGLLNQFSNLREIEGAGFDRYGSLTGGAIAAVRNLLPITRDELDAAKSTKGKSWAYMAKVIANYREQDASTADAPGAGNDSAGDYIDDFYAKWGPNGTERPQEF